MITRPFYKVHKQRPKITYLSEYQLDLRDYIYEMLYSDTIPDNAIVWGKSAFDDHYKQS